MPPTLQHYLAVGSAGFLGAVARLFIARLCQRVEAFPLGTFIINISGSFLLGFFLVFVARFAISDTIRLAVAVGFLGAYTTFSTFMYETTTLAQRGALLVAAANILLSLIVGLLAVWFGMLTARLF